MISTETDATPGSGGTLLAALAAPPAGSPAAPLHRAPDGSYAAYFSAFPASYWAHWSILDRVELRVSVRGSGTLRVVASDALGAARTVESVEVADSSPAALTLPLAGLDDGGWYWFELDGGAELVSGGWWAPEGAHAARTIRPTIVITTLDRERYLLPVLESLGSDPEVLGMIERVVVVDHGSRRLVDADGYAEATAALGASLRVIRQANLGGSGGFARGMLEAVDAHASAVILLDDDVAIDPESIRRLVRFAEFGRTPMLVGGHMLDMATTTRLHAMAESIRPDTFFWHTNGPSRHDFARGALAETPWLHRRLEADYNGWWMCLIPAEALTGVGLAMPFFLKWDDAEYGVRAASAGIPTVSLPGAAIWHVSWDQKDDTVSWQGYFHARNRLIAALLHSQRPRGGRVVAANFSLSVRYLFALEYGAQLLRNQAYRDVLAGPEHLHEQLATGIGEVRRLLATTASGTPLPLDEWHALVADVPRSPRRAEVDEHPGSAAVALRALPVLWRNLLPVRRGATDAPRAWLALTDARWWNVGRYDSVLTESPDGAGGRWLRRDRRLAFALMRDAWRLSRRLRREWPELAARYRAAAPELASPERWRRTLA